MSVATDRALQVALPLPLPRLFDYLAPVGASPCADMAGSRVRVPFGSRELVGVVVGTAAADPATELRTALAWLDEAPVLTGELLESLRWLARYTHAPLGEVLATALPAAMRRGEALPDTHGWAWQRTALAIPALRGRPRALADLLQPGARDEPWLETALPGWRPAARSLARRGLVVRIAAPAGRPVPAPQAGPSLHPAQAEAVAAITGSAGFASFLLDGVTGSGKTEVYLQAIAHCLARGRQALVLVPEIGLTPQMLARFRARLGVPIHALHSGLTDGERARTWAAAWRGEARVIVGTRSAIFTPLPEAGLLVVDEEHDGSYKQQDGIRYHARDFALVRGKALAVPVVLGSATPSLESLHNAREGRHAHLLLRHRAAPELLAAIGGAVAAGGQVLVFKNRRGYAPVLLCHDCGWSARCRRCGSASDGRPMTVHGIGRRLQCHHCGARQSVPLACPDCASLALQPQGAGTERIEDLLTERFADVPVLRIDRGSTRGRDSLEQHFADFGDRPGILVGTQMLAKGHDLPNLTLVAVVGIDEGLFSTDFRAGEKLAQLLVQVAGRAGRADKPGEVLLQTHHPGHPLLHLLLAGGYASFAEAELGQREAAGFPPFAHLAMLRAEAKAGEAPMAFLAAARDCLRAVAPAADDAAQGVQLHGPVVAPMARRAGMHRCQLLLSAPGRPMLHAALQAAMPGIHALPAARKVRWSLDVDPVDLY